VLRFRKFGRGKGIRFFAAAANREAALRALAASGAATLDDYFAVRLALLEHVTRANSRVSKLAFGRLAWFQLIKEAWNRLSTWTASSRATSSSRASRSGSPSEALLPHAQPRRGRAPLRDNTQGQHLGDGNPGGESPLDVLLPAHSDDAAAKAFWAH
jgi:hypothetical protein